MPQQSELQQVQNENALLKKDHQHLQQKVQDWREDSRSRIDGLDGSVGEIKQRMQQIDVFIKAAKVVGAFFGIGAALGAIIFFTTLSKLNDMDAVVDGHITRIHEVGEESLENFRSNSKAIIAEMVEDELKPDFDSGWRDIVTGQKLDLVHDLNVVPSRIVIQLSQDSDGTEVFWGGDSWIYLNEEQGRGVIVSHVTDKKLRVYAGQNILFDTFSITGHQERMYLSTEKGTI